MRHDEQSTMWINENTHANDLCYTIACSLVDCSLSCAADARRYEEFKANLLSAFLSHGCWSAYPAVISIMAILEHNEISENYDPYHFPFCNSLL